MATRKMKATALPAGLSEEAREEILERRRAVEAELAAREAERQSAWVEHERERKDAEERRKATEPPKEFQEAAKAARERFEKERIEHWRDSFQKECKRRNADEALEERFLEEEREMAERHLAVYARFQDAMTGGEADAERQAVADMAAAWKEKETTLAVLATSKKRGPSKAEARLEAKSEALKEKLADLEKSKADAVKKPKAKKAAAPKKKK